jgi:hypothetical protein
VDEYIDDPGANNFCMAACQLLKDDSTSVFVDDPTAILDDIHAGELMELQYASFPVAIAVAIPTARKLSMAAFRESPSQADP